MRLCSGPLGDDAKAIAAKMAKCPLARLWMLIEKDPGRSSSSELRPGFLRCDFSLSIKKQKKTTQERALALL